MGRLFEMFLLSCVLFSCLTTCHGANILGIFHSPSISHQLPFQAVMKALAARGHQITVISPNPIKPPVPNYTDIDVSKSYEFVTNWDVNSWTKLQPVDTMVRLSQLMVEILEYQVSSPEVQELMRSNKTFDLVMIEPRENHVLHGLIHHFGSPPVVGIHSMGGMSSAYESMGNPSNPAYSPELMAPYSDHMTFWQRMHNLYMNLRILYMIHYEVLPIHEKLLRKYFGSGPPSVYESNYNMSLVLLGNHWSLNYPRPLLPNVVELTGLHLQTTPKPLPKDIKSFLDGGKDGVIYFSLGSNVKSKDLPEAKLRQILQAFSELPQRVLWKFEADSLTDIPSNVRLGKWLPQQDILAHPNVRVFITQGGLQSFQEAAYYGVPLIGIPFFADQFHDVAKFEAANIGVKLLIDDLNKETLLEALKKVLHDPSIRESMERFSAVYREEAGTSMDRAIWWIEYVIRHNGAPHLRSAALDLTWYQYLLLDVIAVLLLGFIAVLVISFITLRKLISFIRKALAGKKLKKS